MGCQNHNLSWTVSCWRCVGQAFTLHSCAVPARSGALRQDALGLCFKLHTLDLLKHCGECKAYAVQVQECSTSILRSTNILLGLVCLYLLHTLYKALHPEASNQTCTQTVHQPLMHLHTPWLPAFFRQIDSTCLCNSFLHMPLCHGPLTNQSRFSRTSCSRWRCMSAQATSAKHVLLQNILVWLWLPTSLFGLCICRLGSSSCSRCTASFTSCTTLTWVQ